MVARGDVIWANLGPPAGRRPMCVITRDAAIPVLGLLTCAPITRTVRGIPSEVEVGKREGLPNAGVINCDNVVTVLKSQFDSAPVGRLSQERLAALNEALRYALGIDY